MRSAVHYSLGRRLAAVGVVALALAGCGPKTLAVGYVPTGITPESQLPALAVFRFVDKRGEEEPRRIGGMYGVEPAADTVTRAFAAGLRAREFPVMDATTAPFTPQVSRPDTRVALSGEILRFWTEHFWAHAAECRVVLHAYEVATGRRVWQREYGARNVEGPVPHPASTDLLRDNLATVLAKTVEAVVNDPDLVRVAKQW